MTVKVPEGVVFMYSVVVKPPWSRDYRRRDRNLYHQVVKEWKFKCPQIQDPFGVVFNGKDILYAARAFQAKDIEPLVVTVPGETKDLEFTVSDVKMLKAIPINDDIHHWLQNGRSGDIPQDIMTIKGSKEATRNAKKIIEKQIHEENKNLEVEACTLSVEIPLDIVGRIIGLKGHNIQDICSRTGAECRIGEEVISGVKQMTIKGSEEATRNAKQIFEEQIHELLYRFPAASKNTSFNQRTYPQQKLSKSDKKRNKNK